MYLAVGSISKPQVCFIRLNSILIMCLDSTVAWISTGSVRDNIRNVISGASIFLWLCGCSCNIGTESDVPLFLFSGRGVISHKLIHTVLEMLMGFC